MKIVIPYLRGFRLAIDCHIHFIRDDILISENGSSISLAAAIRNGWGIKAFLI